MADINHYLNTPVPQSIVLSPCGRYTVFSTAHRYRSAKDGRPGPSRAALWLGEVHKAGSARQLTSGDFDDRDPQWLVGGLGGDAQTKADGVVFVSDRAKPGNAGRGVYFLPVATSGEAVALTETGDQGVEMLRASPVGGKIGYLSADERSAELKKREEEGWDAEVHGEDWAFNRLRIVHLGEKGAARQQTLVSRTAHVCDWAWNATGDKIVFAETETTETASRDLHGMAIGVVDVASGHVVMLARFGAEVSSLAWEGENVYWIGPVTEGINSANCVYSITDAGKSIDARSPEWNARYSRVMGGDVDCAMQLVQAKGGRVVVFIESGMEDHLRLLDGHTLFSQKKKIEAVDLIIRPGRDDAVIALSRGSVNSMPEVYTTTTTNPDMIRISNLDQNPHPTHHRCIFISGPSADNKVILECPLLLPTSASLDADGKPLTPLPTFVLVHGGPYYRISDQFDDIFFFLWTPALLAAGYAVLIPSYRGNSGHGESFAAPARGTGGIYDDVISMTDLAVCQHFADPLRLAIGGWSQGGFMTYLASVRNGTHGLGWSFRAAIAGAGVSDMATMCFTSDLGATFQADCAGGAPWTLDPENVHARANSAVWQFAQARKNKVPIPPLLILHGAADERVPLEQGVAMRRAMHSAGLTHTFVSYPRENHIFQEAPHVADMAERVLRWVQRWVPGDAGAENWS